MKNPHYKPDIFALYLYSKDDMDEYHQHVYDSFGETEWQVMMHAFITVASHKCNSDSELKELIDDFIYELIQNHFNT